MVEEEFAEASVGHSRARCALHDIQIGPTIPFDDDGAIIGDGDVPADNDSIGKHAMRPRGEAASFLPEWELPPADPSAAIWMAGKPTQSSIHPKVGRKSEFAGGDINCRRDSSRMEIIDAMIVANCHPQNCGDDLGAIPLVETAQDTRGRQGSVIQIPQ
jgi:hypothetical protein